MNSLIPLALAAVMLPGLIIAQDKNRPDYSTVKEFDLNRYLGRWYEIARFDHSFEKGMDNVIAEYLLQDDGKVSVTNTGWKNGKYKVAEGKAKQPEPLTDPGHLKVSFFLFFYSDYNVMMIDSNYQVALVGSKSPDYLWILSRTPTIRPEIEQLILEEAQDRGYDISKLIWVNQKLNEATF
ncbi:MAG: lipocalin [Bacteroidales bacterium]|nr:lipocalin [Bacteroidales bacterium]